MKIIGMIIHIKNCWKEWKISNINSNYFHLINILIVYSYCDFISILRFSSLS